MGDPAPPLMFRRWTEDEDRVLLQHVADRGTKQWAHLHASGRLRDRDNKACCNRYRILKGKMAQGQRPAPRPTAPTTPAPQIKLEWAPEQEGGAHTSLPPPARGHQRLAAEDSLILPLWQAAPDPPPPPPPRPDDHLPLPWPGPSDGQLLGAWQGGLEGRQDLAEGAGEPWELFSDAVAPFLAPMDSLPDQPLTDLTDPRHTLEAPAAAGLAVADGGVLSASAISERNGRLGTPCRSSVETASSEGFLPCDNNENVAVTPLARRRHALPGAGRESCQLPLGNTDAGSLVSWDLRQEGCHRAATGAGTGAGACTARELLPCQSRMHAMRLQKACASLQSFTATRHPAVDARGLFSFGGHHPDLVAGEPSTLRFPLRHTPLQSPHFHEADAAAGRLAPSGLLGQGSSCLSSLTRTSSSASLGPIRQLSSHASDVRSRHDARGAPAYPPGCAVQLAMPAWLGMSSMPVGPQTPSLQATSDSGSSWDQALPCAGQGMMLRHHAHTTGAHRPLWGRSDAQAYGSALEQSRGEPSGAHSLHAHALAMPAWDGHPLRSARLASEDAHLRSLSPSVCSGLGPSPEAPWPHSGVPPARCAGGSGSGTLDEQLDALGHLDQSLTRKRKLVSLGGSSGGRDQQWYGECKPLVAWNRHPLLWNRGGSTA